MEQRYVVANWKSNKTASEAERWLDTFLGAYRPVPELRVILAPSLIHLASLHQRLEPVAPSLVLAAQDVSPFPLGAYTGAVAAAMLQGMADYAIIGHAERRRYFHESNQEIANKASEAVAAGIVPILCLDRPYARAQLAAIDEAALPKLIIGYGPTEAIGLDIPQPLERIGEAVRELAELAPDRPILYGGSVNAANAAEIMALPGVAGLMVGSASLDADEFVRICEAVRRA